jgi:WD40 repeat protein
MRFKVTLIFYILTLFSLRAQQRPQLVLPLAHTSYIQGLKFSPDGRNILTSSADGTAKIWDKFSGKLISTIDSLSENEVALYTPDGQGIFTYPGIFSEKKEFNIRLWDAAAGSLVKTFTGHKSAIEHIAISPNGKWMVSCSYDTTAVLWDTRTGKALLRMDSFNLPPGHVQFSPNGKQFAIYTTQFNKTQWDYQVQLWDAERKIKIANYNTSGGPIGNMQFSPDGTKLLVGMLWHTNAYVFDTQTGDLAYELNGHTGNLRYGVFFTPDGSKIITSAADSTIRFWDAKNGAPLKTILAHKGDIDYVVISPDGKYLASSSDEDKMVVKWEVATGHFLAKWETTEQMRGSLEFSAKGNYILYRASDRSRSAVYVFDANKYTLVRKIENGEDYCMDSSERYMCVETRNSFLPKILLAQTGQELYQLGTAPEDIKRMQFLPQTNRLLYKSAAGTQRLWDIETGEQEQLFYNNKQGEVMAATVINNQTVLALATNNYEVQIYKGANKRATYSVKGGDYNVSHLIFSPTQQYFAVFGDADKFYSDMVRVYETETGKLISTFDGVSFSIKNSAFSADEKKLITSGFMDPVFIWDIEGQKLDTILYASKTPYFSEDYDKHEYVNDNTAISPNRKWVATTYKNHEFLHVWDIDAKTIEGEYKTNTAIWGTFISQIEFTGKGNYFAINYFNSSDDLNSPGYNSRTHNFVVVYKRGSKEPYFVVEGGTKFVFSPDEKYVAVPADKKLLVYDLATQKMVYSAPFDFSHSPFVQWETEGRLLAVQDAKGNIEIISIEQKKSVNKYKIEGRIETVDWQHGRIIAYQNSALHLHQITTGKENVALVMLGGRDAAKVTPDGYYQAVPDDARLLGWKYKNNIYDFTRWDMQYNRPDKVLQAFGSTNTNLINIHQNAWQKRVRKTHTDTTLFNSTAPLPEIELLNAADIEGLQTASTITLKISAKELQQTNRLKNVEVIINGTPLYGQNGLAINAADTTLLLPVTLSTGINKIKISCTNTVGLQSLDKVVYTTYNPTDTVQPRVWYIGIGVSEYADATHNLRYAAKDVNDMATTIKQKFNAQTLLLTNGNVTLQNILALKQTLINKTKPDDVIILSLSGHGTVDTAYDFYFATHDMDFKHPVANGLSYDKLVWLLDSIPARQKLVLMDACHSGEMDKETLLGIKDAENDSISATRSGIELLVDESEQKIGMKNTFRLMQDMFAGSAQNNGATIISAAAGTEFAFEGNNWKNGVFTYCILKGLTEKLADEDGDGQITVSELQHYVADNVELLTQGRQRPTSRQTNFDNNWVVWK